VDKFGSPLDKDVALKRADRILPLLDGHLAFNEWLACGHPTIADCAVFPYVALSHEGGVSLEPYANIQAWIKRVKGLPNFKPMPGV
jgi:glutathione S-transferase